MVGDSQKDIQAGRAARCVTICVGQPGFAFPEPADHNARDIAHAAGMILKELN